MLTISGTEGHERLMTHLDILETHTLCAPFHRPTPTFSGLKLNDLHAFDSSRLSWTDLSGLAGSPSPRTYHGVAESAGLLFVFGGSNSTGRIDRDMRLCGGAAALPSVRLLAYPRQLLGRKPMQCLWRPPPP